jgi:hypothetical protein
MKQDTRQNWLDGSYQPMSVYFVSQLKHTVIRQLKASPWNVDLLGSQFHDNVTLPSHYPTLFIYVIQLSKICINSSLYYVNKETEIEKYILLFKRHSCRLLTLFESGSEKLRANCFTWVSGPAVITDVLRKVRYALIKNLKEREHLLDLEVDGTVILNLIRKEI